MGVSGWATGFLSVLVGKKIGWTQKRRGGVRQPGRVRITNEACLAPPFHFRGELHRYLGRSYRLQLLPCDPSRTKAQVILTETHLVVAGPRPLTEQQVERLLRAWYRAQAQAQFEATLSELFEAQHWRPYRRPRLLVREMRARWGSLSSCGKMTLNMRLIQAPLVSLEYVIVHELCHLVHQNHGQTFMALLASFMPEWKVRKRQLEGIS